MIKLIAIDMDGTLLNSKKEIPKQNQVAIQAAAEKGVKIVICTGRAQSGVVPFYEELGLSAKEEYAILNNGCSIHQTSDWSLVDYAYLEASDIAFLADKVKAYPQVQLVLTEKEDFLVVDEEPSELVRYDASLVFAEPVSISSQKSQQADKLVFQAMFMGDPEAIDAFQAQEEATLAERFSVVRSQPYIFEVMPKGVTKASGLKKLAEHLSIAPSEIMALGDAGNDAEMLAYAGLSVAMGNATPAIKALATVETADHDQAGVGLAIEKYVL